MDEKYYSTEDVAKHFGVVSRTIFRFMEDGLLHGMKVGKAWRFTERDVAECAAKLRERSERELAELNAKRAARKAAQEADKKDEEPVLAR